MEDICLKLEKYKKINLLLDFKNFYDDISSAMKLLKNNISMKYINCLKIYVNDFCLYYGIRALYLFIDQHMLLTIQKSLPNRYIYTVNAELKNKFNVYLINVTNKAIRSTYENLKTLNLYQLKANNKKTYETYKNSIYNIEYVTHCNKLHIVKYDLDDLQIKLDLLCKFKSVYAINNAILFMYGAIKTLDNYN